ncbi:MAG: lacZ, partial [Paenibacillaceae bacterium]|nr:lacZ [Paenibacillaceae bacterium]
MNKNQSLAKWQPAGNKIRTRWAKEVSPERVWSEYPRPNLVRSDWQSLNGLWNYKIVGDKREWNEGRVENAKADLLCDEAYLSQHWQQCSEGMWDGRILVPFAVESALSGVGKLMRPHQTLWYQRTFELAEDWKGQRIILHFEAVDWHAVVWVNGVKVGEHRGGYVPFALDITEALKQKEQEIVVAVWDPTNMGDQSLGKQALPENRKGYRYVPTTGIWQSVWLEPVPQTSIERLSITPDVDNDCVHIEAFLTNASHATDECILVEILDMGRITATGSASLGGKISIKLDHPKLWSPDEPFLYDMNVKLQHGSQTIDEVTSYFGMRKISIQPDELGIQRIMLNNQPIFQYGPLDQGYWPDGILTPPSDEAARFDLQYLKDIGCNMVRVHIKIHPARWYAHCDRLGLIVWQDMVCTRKFEPNITPESSAQWQREQKEMIDHLYNHPSVAHWIVFNEAWGQHDTERLTQWTMAYDPSRLVTNASGWTDYEIGHLHDTHDYSFHPSIPDRRQLGERAIVLGEVGGFDVLVPGHIWHEDQQITVSWDPVAEISREKYANAQEWSVRYQEWLKGLKLLQSLGLNAAVYTQITDVEHECNGWMTYDREISKIEPSILKKWHSELYVFHELLHLQSVAADSSLAPQHWQYKLIAEDVAADEAVLLDPNGWQMGVAPFGSP